MNPIQWVEQGLVPDVIARAGMRQLIRRRLTAPDSREPDRRTEAFQRFLGELRSSPIAVNTADANVQHYEVPAEFFHRHLGPCLKYSCCYYPSGTETLAEAEQHMLALYAERAGLKDGMRILDLGCGWGSLSASVSSFSTRHSSAASTTCRSSPATSSIFSSRAPAWNRASTACSPSRCSST
jgi:cyclopropane-fatty-acyl-phospholipid synthase